MGSGIIYAAIVAVWAAVLVPMWLRHHDELTESHSVDRFSRAMRILARRGVPMSSLRRGADLGIGDQRLVTMPMRPTGSTGVVRSGGPRIPSPVAAASRARVRRARVLVGLAAVTVVLLGLAALGVMSFWLPALTALALAAHLVACRRAAALAAARRRPARRVMERYDDEPVGHAADLADASWAVSESHDLQPTLRRSEIWGLSTNDAAASRSSVVAAQLEELRAVPSQVQRAMESLVSGEGGEDAGAGSWSPTPVPLPTYVSKPKAAGRLARSIDLSGDGIWSSGRGGQLEIEHDPSREPLPQAQPAASYDLPVEDDELDAILGRKWAVGD